MRVPTCAAMLATAWLLAGIAAARADVIELTDGQRVVGTVTEATTATIVVDVHGREMPIGRERVRSITFEATPAATPSASPSARSAEMPVRYIATPSAARRPVAAEVAAALAVVDKLQAMTLNAPSADYAARVREVRRDVDRALGEQFDEGDVRSAIVTAVGYHAFAARARTVYETRGDLAAIGRDAIVAECDALRTQIAREADALRLDSANPTVIGLLAATEGTPALRACAAEKLAEAEALARAPR